MNITQAHVMTNSVLYDMTTQSVAHVYQMQLLTPKDIVIVIHTGSDLPVANM